VILLILRTQHIIIDDYDYDGRLLLPSPRGITNCSEWPGDGSAEDILGVSLLSALGYALKANAPGVPILRPSAVLSSGSLSSSTSPGVVAVAAEAGATAAADILPRCSSKELGFLSITAPRRVMLPRVLFPLLRPLLSFLSFSRAVVLSTAPAVVVGFLCCCSCCGVALIAAVLLAVVVIVIVAVVVKAAAAAVAAPVVLLLDGLLLPFSSATRGHSSWYRPRGSVRLSSD
jgi:hypothetical protein